MSTSIVPTTHEFLGVTSAVVRDHQGDVTVTHRPGDPSQPDDGLARVRLLHADGLELVDVTVVVDGGTLVVEVPRQDVGPDGRRRGFALGPITIGGTGTSVGVEVELPADVPVQLHTRYGNVRVTGTSGDATVRTGAGNVQLERALTVSVSTGAGDLRIGSCTGGSATTGTGGVTVRSNEGALHVRTGAGDVKVLATSGGELTAATGAGDIRAHLLSGSIQARSGAGDVKVTVPRGEPVWLDLNAGLGSVRKELDPVGAPAEGQPHLSVHARTGLGDITVRHPDA